MLAADYQTFFCRNLSVGSIESIERLDMRSKPNVKRPHFKLIPGVKTVTDNLSCHLIAIEWAEQPYFLKNALYFAILCLFSYSSLA